MNLLLEIIEIVLIYINNFYKYIYLVNKNKLYYRCDKRISD